MKSDYTWEQAVLWLRQQVDQHELVRACYYDDPILEAAKRFEASEEWGAIRNILPPKIGKALDIGAGRGISSYALAKAGWQVTSLEPDSSPVVGREAIQSIALQSNLPIFPLEGYAEKIPTPDAQFDLVFGRQVMHHARNLQTMCNEIIRVLKPGGMFISTREHVISRKEDLPVFLANHPLHHLYGGENAYLLDEYLVALKNAGMQIYQILGPMATIINYFPATRMERLESIQSPVSWLFGSKIKNFLISDNLPWSPAVNNLLSKYADSRNITPGRLYSFIAKKKST
jgi:SAM-dependent methyltransferase